ncbi:MAG: selenocysteine-specific translation elongation factor [Planctomycetota bacterium]|jgi:selenocysteine-specific elongation factor
MSNQINITLGTAGHIDHGKTVLVKCLTGCETDRLKVEKERGMSIELGFAPCTIADMEVGIVDVPGHENFIKTMVAGAMGIDAIIFVIAADDGVMPQTREHLEILTLLGINKGIVALTKRDCVTNEQLDKVTKEIKQFLKGTFLEDAPVSAMSGVTGEGFDFFYESLKDLVKSIHVKSADGPFRLPVERAFSLKGFGTVVSGIPVSGMVKVGDELTLLPQNKKGKIKAIQVYGKESDTALCGQCAALNVPQWDYKTIVRGNVVTNSDYFEPQTCFLCKIQVLQSSKMPVKHAGSLNFHTGTSKVSCKVYLMESNTLSAGQQGLGQIKLSEPITAGPRDHFILRSMSPTRTVGGGMIIEELSTICKRRKEILTDAKIRAKEVVSDQSFINYCIRYAKGHSITQAQLSLRVKLPRDFLRRLLSDLVEEGKVIKLSSNSYIHSDTITETKNKLSQVVSQFHRQRPESPGISYDELLKSSGLQKEVVEGTINSMLSDNKIIKRKQLFALPDHHEKFSDQESQLMEAIEKLFIDRLFCPPKIEEITKQVKATTDEVQKIQRVLLEQQILMKVEKDLFFHQKAINKAEELLRKHIEKEGPLESVKFKYLLDTTRKYAIPLLDYFDKIGVTRRVGYTRYLKENS